jgi:DNA-binding response OmpR family regulator
MKKILVVEDEASLQDPLVEKLVSEGFDVVRAENGEIGLAQALDLKPDLILLDIMMPRMDGLEMLKALRQDEWGKTAKVIVLTNGSESSSLADVLESDVTDYLVKVDVSLEEIVAKVRTKLQ